jgi:hypothetical protein
VGRGTGVVGEKAGERVGWKKLAFAILFDVAGVDTYFSVNLLK